MKPIIIQVPSTKDGKVTLTVKELQEMLDKAYESGKNDGTTNYGYCPYRPWYYNYSDTTTPLNTTPHITWTSTNTSTDATISGNNICSGSTNCCS